MSNESRYPGVYQPPDKWAHERSNLERAGLIALKMEDAYRAMWSGYWPHGHCMNTCLTLAPLIRKSLDWNVLIAIGAVLGGRRHAWLESPEHDVLDPTFGQFGGGPALRVLPPSQSQLLGHQPLLRLSLVAEVRALAGFRPYSRSGSVWDKDCGVLELFSDDPFTSPLAHC